MMKIFIAVAILFSLIALPVRAELTETDLEKIRQIFLRQIFREELETPITDHVDTSFREIEEPLDGIETHFDGIERSLDRMQMMLWIATILVVVAGIVNWMDVLKLWRSR